MKAVVNEQFGDPNVLRIDDIPLPEISSKQVLIKVITSSVNRPDIVQRQGNYPPLPGESKVLGLEVAGIIESVGEGVSDWKIGDRVISLVGGGGYAEYAVAWAEHLMPVPDGLNWAQAACVCETYITAYLNIFLNTDFKNGQNVLIHGGSGGIGTAAIQLINALAPDSNIFTTCSAEKHERLMAMNVNRVIDHAREDFVDIVMKETEKAGVAVILDHIGGPYLQKNLKCLSKAGALVVIGVMGGAKSEVNLAQLMIRRQKIIGSVLRSRPINEKSAIISKFKHEVIPLFENANLLPLVDKIFPLEDVINAHQHMESANHFGKIVLHVDQTVKSE